MANKDNENMFSSKMKIIRFVIHTISCFLIILAIFFPWIQIRNLSLNLVYILCAEHIDSYSLSYSYIIGDYLQRFEITTSYTSSFAYNNGIIRCDPEHMFYFKKFCDNLNIDAVLRPYRYYLAHNSTGACQLEYYNANDGKNKSFSINSNSEKKERLSTKNSPFRLFYIFKYNSTHDMTRLYTETTDFRNWNYLTDGRFVNFIESNLSTTKFNRKTLLKEPFWTTGLASFGSQNESRVFTIIYPILGKNDENATFVTNDEINLNKNYFRSKYWYAKSIPEAKAKIKPETKTKKDITDDDVIINTTVGSSFFTESLFLILKEKTLTKHFHYIITDYMYNVLIDNEMGAIYPKYFNNKNMAIFPNISDINSSLWNSVEKEIINVPDDVPLLVNVSTTIQYMIIKRVIHTRSRYSFYLIMLIELNEKTSEIYTSVTQVFLICFILLVFSYFIARFLIIYIKSKRKKKLKSKQEFLLENDFNISKNDKNQYFAVKNNLPFCGTIIDAIEDLRLIQLKNVDDTHLNNMIDSVIEEITRNSDELFNTKFSLNTKKSKHSDKNFYHLKCLFCSYLVDSNNDFTVLKDKEIYYKKKREKENQKINQILIHNLNSNSQNIYNDECEIKNDFYMESKDKFCKNLFSLWDIEMKTVLNQKISKEMLSTNPHKYLVLKFMKIIQEGNFFFKEFYPDSLLIFILTFTKENISCYHCKIKSLKLLKKLIKNNFKFWIKSKKDIFILFLALILRHSKLKSSNQILNLFQSFIGCKDKYFFSLLKVLIDETSSNNVMNIYGQLINRRQSPNFSVFNNPKDLVLFMKALLAFSDFAPYLTKNKENEQCFNEINKSIFSEDEKQNMNLIYDFHFELSKNVVCSWFNLMKSFSSMNEIQTDLYKNVNYWFKKSH